MWDCTGCQTCLNVSEKCVVQDVRTCLNQHIKRTEKCVRLYRMSEPVYINTPREQRNVSDCTGCQNLSKSHTETNCTGCQNLSISAHQENREMCQIVQGTCQKQRNVSDCTGQNLNTHQESREMCQIVQDVRTCLNQHTKRAEKCVRLYRMSEPV